MLDEKTKELVAVGAAITAHCQPCLEYHSAKARELGAADTDILTAIEVGKLVRRGADQLSSRCALIPWLPEPPIGGKGLAQLTE